MTTPLLPRIPPSLDISSTVATAIRLPSRRNWCQDAATIMQIKSHITTRLLLLITPNFPTLHLYLVKHPYTWFFYWYSWGVVPSPSSPNGQNTTVLRKLFPIPCLPPLLIAFSWPLFLIFPGCLGQPNNLPDPHFPHTCYIYTLLLCPQPSTSKPFPCIHLTTKGVTYTECGAGSHRGVHLLSWVMERPLL